MNQQQTHFNLDVQTILQNIKSKIERDLEWGSSQKWTGSDFEKLSELILDKTGQSISVSTLKRLWGRTSQQVYPTTTTLNILANFTGAESWRKYDMDAKENDNAFSSKAVEDSKSLFRNVYLTLGIMILTIGGLLIWMSFRNSNASLIVKGEEIKFNLSKVTSGIPNTVVFTYSIGSNSFDSLELQQSWDQTRRSRIDASDSIITSTYMSPGYFNAKLVGNGQILKTQNVYIPSDGPQAMITTEARGRQMLDKNNWLIGSDGFRFSEAFHKKYTSEKIEQFGIVNLLEKPIISGENFSAKVAFEIPHQNNEDPCHGISILITGSQDVYMINFGVLGCSGKFGAYLGGERISGKNHDLSNLGFKLQQEAHFHFKKEGPLCSASMNGQEIVLSQTTMDIGQIGGIRVLSDQELRLIEMELKDENNLINLIKEI